MVFFKDGIRCYLLSTAICILLQDEIEDFCKHITADICSKLHPHALCKFWKKSYGAVPDAVSRVPINDEVFCKEFLLCPEPDLGESLRTCRVACPTMTGQHCIAHGIAAHGMQPK